MRQQPFSEDALIRQAQAGDRQAFADLVRQYERRVLAVAFRIVEDADLARDVAQEVFIKLYAGLPGFHAKNRFFTWLYRITVNASFDALRREKRFQAQPLEGLVIAGEGAADAPAQRAELANVMDGLMARLSHPQRTALMLKEVEGFNAREVAQIMGCAHGTVRSHLHGARSRLRSWIEAEYPEWMEEMTL